MSPYFPANSESKYSLLLALSMETILNLKVGTDEKPAREEYLFALWELPLGELSNAFMLSTDGGYLAALWQSVYNTDPAMLADIVKSAKERTQPHRQERGHLVTEEFQAQVRELCRIMHDKMLESKILGSKFNHSQN